MQMVYMQAKEIQLALRSGVHSSVAWSLNALTVLSFNAKPPLLLTQHPGLLDALLQAWQTLFSCCCFLSAINAHVQRHISIELTLALTQRQAMQWVLVCTHAISFVHTYWHNMLLQRIHLLCIGECTQTAH